MQAIYSPNILTIKELGFTKVIYDTATVRYIKNGINMRIEFNPEDTIYIWYLVTTI